jgi:hypothetical protein
MDGPHYQVVVVTNGVRNVRAVSLTQRAAEERAVDLARLFQKSQVSVELMPGKQTDPSPPDAP